MKKQKLSVIVNVNLEIKTNTTSVKKALLFAQNYELPKEYIEDTFEQVKVIDENGKTIKKLNN